MADMINSTVRCRASSPSTVKSSSTSGSMANVPRSRERSPAPPTNEPDTESPPERLWPNISRPRFWLVFLSLWISLFLSTIDTTIVTTALLPISMDLPDKINPAWVLVSYLLTYTSFLLVSSSVCEIFSIKTVLICCNIGFLLTSLACSLARTMKQLIIFRALQGASASGLYNLPFVVVLKVVEPKKVSLYTTLIGGVFVMANLLGPVLGGILASAGKWRVMFSMNIPLATLAFVLLFVAAPDTPGPFVNRAKWRSMDRIGGLMSIVWIAPIVSALQEGDDEWTWDSAVSQGLLIGGGLLMVIFIWYELFYLTKRKSEIDPVFPIFIFKAAPVFWLMINALLIGATFYGGITLLPSRLQIVNGLSAKSAGLHLLVMMMTVPMGAFTGAELSHRFAYGAQWIALAGSTMVLTGTVLLAFLHCDQDVPASSWVAQCHLGIGFGLLGAIALFVQKDNVSYFELASAISIYDMFRAMGGTIGVAFCSAVMRRNLRNEFAKVLSPHDVESLLKSNFGSVKDLSPSKRDIAREAYGHVFSYQFVAIAIAAGINVLVAMIMVWTRYFVGFSLERRGDCPYQHWRKEENDSDVSDDIVEHTAAQDFAVNIDAGENIVNGHRTGDDANVAESRVSSPTEQRKSSAPTLPRLSRFEDISMNSMRDV